MPVPVKTLQADGGVFLYYEIYVDLLFAENFLMNYMLLRLTLRFLSCSATHRRSAVCAAVGSAGYLGWMWMCSALPPGIMAGIGIAGITGMVKFGCNTRNGKQLVLGLFSWLMMSFWLSGGIRLLERMAGKKGMTAAAAAGLVVYAAVTVFLKIREQQKKVQKRTVTVYLGAGGKWKKVKGLYDTGNGLWDATSRRPVSVIPFEILKELFPEEMREELAAFVEGETVRHPELLTALQPHYIRFRSVGCAAGMLPVIRIPEMLLVQGNTKKRVNTPVLALTGKDSTAPTGCQMILHPDLMDS